MTLKFSEKQWLWALLLAFIGGAVISIIQNLAGSPPVNWMFELGDGIILSILSIALVMLIYLPAWNIVKKKEWFVWPIVAISFIGMVTSQSLFGSLEGRHLLDFWFFEIFALIGISYLKTPESISRTTNHTQNHKHKCNKCGTIWEHGNESVNNINAHKCPQCKTVQWWKYTSE